MDGYWIEEYSSQIGEKVKLWECPCCGYPTLKQIDGYEICELCNWEDEGQGDDDADRVLGGSNGDYSLTEARQNFRQYLIMYRPLDERFCSLRDKKIDTIKKEIMALYNNRNENSRTEELEKIFKLFLILKKMQNNLTH